ncbi:hypothetical protein CEQ90_11145 [Lewinellaceae bacterium SD302]|nr:hypothetical protein CEQ90_11145 [Lewinellaceae bacterium SD302]
MANKTTPTNVSVSDFLATVDNEQKRADAQTIIDLMQEITGESPVMWGPSIIGFGKYHYTYASGREGDWMETGFSPRKSAISLYLMGGIGRQADLLEKLGKYKTGKSCLYIKRLSDVDMDVLRELIATSVKQVRNGDIQY